MKLLIFSDPHWSAYSSIVRSRGKKYSTRLENLLESLNWVELEAQENRCDAILCLGDFFDKCDLTSEEITAVQEIKWNEQINHIFLVGNHEMGRSNLEFSSSHLFNLCPNSTVIDYPQNYCVGNTEICFLPYILESNREDLNNYFNFWTPPQQRIIFSHNDIKGIQMGNFLSTEGFTIDDIKSNCSLFINGHLHNMSYVDSNIINIGNLTGQNFSEDATVYKHCIIILDTDTLKYEFIENPYAMNFYKYDFTSQCDSMHESLISETIQSMHKNSVLTVKVKSNYYDYIKSLISDNSNILEARILIDTDVTTCDIQQSQNTQVNIDHLAQFVDYIKSELGTTPDILEELKKVVS